MRTKKNNGGKKMKISIAKRINGEKISFRIENDWNDECDLFRGFSIKLGFFRINISRSLS